MRKTYRDRLADIPNHSAGLSAEADVPVLHQKRASNDAWNLLPYIEEGAKARETRQHSFEQHVHRLNSMVILGLVGAFERFLKESAALCIDHVAEFVGDDRLKEFRIEGNVLSAHFASSSIGVALCESVTWLDCARINERFGSILADLSGRRNFFPFPRTGQGPAELLGRLDRVSFIFQLRHSIIHNAGIVTRSDAIKLRRMLAGSPVDAPRVLWPDKADVRDIKRYLEETSLQINQEVGARLGELLTQILAAKPGSFDAAARSRDLSDRFNVPVSIAGFAASPSAEGPA